MTNRQNEGRTNFFDGQRITEKDLDRDQSYFRGIISGSVSDRGDYGVIDLLSDKERLLLDLKNISAENLSYGPVKAGKFDGSIVGVDFQPSDKVYGNRIEMKLIDVASMGRHSTKILIVGKVFNDLTNSDSIEFEILDFKVGGSLITRKYYNHIYGIVTNNLTGGSSSSESGEVFENLNNFTETSNLIISSVKPLRVFPQGVSVSQNISPSYYLGNFYHNYTNFVNLLDNMIDGNRSESEVFRDFTIRSEAFSAGDDIGNGIGQKFLSSSNNIQSISLLIYLENAGNWTGDLVFSIYELQTSSSSRVSTDPIGFDPSGNPIAQVAWDIDDLARRGIFLNDGPQKINIDFSRFDCSDPLSGKIVKNKYYSILVQRVGSNATNNVYISKGDYIPAGKLTSNIDLNPEEKFSKQTYKMFKYDAATEKYQDYSDESLWFEVASSSIEVTSGSAYSVDGFYINIPKFVNYVGESKILSYKNNIDIPSFNEKLYVMLNRSEGFTELTNHPRTGEYIHSKISDYAEISFRKPPIDLNGDLILASVNDRNTRSTSNITGQFEHAGLYETNFFYIISPTRDQKLLNYVGMNFIPDTVNQSSNEYQIIDYDLYKLRSGDLDRDGSLTLNDSSIIASMSGHTINSEPTERSLFGGAFSIEDFYLADLNNDGAIDGFDILKSEDASAGNINFESGDQIEFLKIHIESLEGSSNPILFSGSGTTAASTNELTLVVTDKSTALSIRIGDRLDLTSSAESYGVLFVKSKSVEADEVTVILGLETESRVEPSFSGDASAALSITSKANTNIFYDNLRLVDTPYEIRNYSIFVDETEFRSFNIEICDLRTFINYSVRKDNDDTCKFDVKPSNCERPPLSEMNVTGDLKVHNNILGLNGLPYRSDIDFANIKIPVPAGTINGCSLDIYKSFIRSSNSSEFTSSGLPALKFSDGTYVGCDDTESSTDVDKNRVKFTYGIASLFIDTDREAANAEVVNYNSNFTDFFEEGYREYRPSNYTSFVEELSSSTNSYYSASASDTLTMGITTSSAPGYARATMLTDGDILDDFILDFSLEKNVAKWETISSGDIRSFCRVNIGLDVNDIGGYFELGLVQYFDKLKLFARTVTSNSNGVELGNEYFEKDFTNVLAKVINFRIRRSSDSIKGYFFIDDNLTDPSALGVYDRIDSNPSKQIGYGAGTFLFEVLSNTATQNKTFYTNISDIRLKSDYSTSQKETNLSISRSATNDVVRLISNLNIPVSSQVANLSYLHSVTLRITPTIDLLAGSEFRGELRALKLINARNFETLNNYYEPSSGSQAFSISGAHTAGVPILIDVKNLIIRILEERNFISGISKAFAFECKRVSVSGATSDEVLQFNVDLNMLFVYTDPNNGVTYKVGVDLDTSTGVMTLNTRNVLYDDIIKENRTVVSVGVLLKKSGFLNQDVEIGVDAVKSLGIGNCVSQENIANANATSMCQAVSGTSTCGVIVGTYVCGSYLSERSEPSPSIYNAVVLVS